MDIVSVGLRVKDDGTIQVQAFGDASEKTAKRIKELEDQINRLSGTQSKGAAAGEGHRLATGKVSRALEGLITSSIGANHHLSTVSVAMSDMALGGAVVTGVLAGIAAVIFIYDKLTESARKAKEEQEKLIQAAKDAIHLKALGPGGSAVDQVAAALAKAEELKKDIAKFEKLANAPIPKGQGEAALQEFFSAREEARHRLKAAQVERQDALDIAAGTQSIVTESVNAAIKDQNDARQAARDQEKAAREKDAAEEVQLQKSVADAKRFMILRELQDIADAQAFNRKIAEEQAQDEERFAQKRADDEKRVTDNLVRQMQDTWSTFFENTLTKGLSSFRDLFSGIKQLFFKMIADMLAANVMQRMAGVFGGIAIGGASAGGGSGGMLSGLGAQMAGQGLAGGVAGGLVGYGVGRMTGSAAGGALTGAAAGAGAGFMVAGPIGALAGGITGLVGGLLGGASAAREAAAAMRQLQKDYTAAIAAFKHDDLSAALAQNAAMAESLRAQAQKLYGTFDAIFQDLLTGAHRLQDATADIAAQEAKNAAMIQRQAKNDLEDLVVRNMIATGQGDAGGLLAFQEHQQREMQAAIDANRDETYRNTLATTLNNELVAYQNGLLSTTIRNSPSGGYGIEGYLGRFATPVGPPGWPTDSGPGRGPDNPRGGVPPLGGGQTRAGLGTINIPIMLDGKQIMKTIVINLDEVAASTGGAGSSRAAAWEFVRR